MYKAIIIEDEQHAASLLENMIREIEPAVQVVEKCGDLPSGIKAIRRHNPQIVFLDIELPVYSGIQLLDFFNPEEVTFQIIFTTASGDHAVRAFEMSAVDYLMKPVQENKLRVAIGKVLSRQSIPSQEVFPVLSENFKPNSSKKLVVPVGDGFEILNLQDIYYLEAEKSYTKIFLVSKRTLVISKNLRHFESMLEGISHFCRVHRSYLVNMDYAKKVIRQDGNRILLENSQTIPVSEEKFDKVLEILQRL